MMGDTVYMASANVIMGFVRYTRSKTCALVQSPLFSAFMVKPAKTLEFIMLG